jgi:hypothetical protein
MRAEDATIIATKVTLDQGVDALFREIDKKKR